MNVIYIKANTRLYIKIEEKVHNSQLHLHMKIAKKKLRIESCKMDQIVYAITICTGTTLHYKSTDFKPRDRPTTSRND